MSTQVSHPPFINTLFPLPTGSGGLLLMKDLENLNDALSIVSGIVDTKISNLSEDLTPQLYSTLTTNNNSINSIGNLVLDAMPDNIANTLSLGIDVQIPNANATTVIINSTNLSTVIFNDYGTIILDTANSHMKVKAIYNYTGGVVLSPGWYAELRVKGDDVGGMNSQVGINTYPSAYLHLPSGQTGVGCGPLKFTSGNNILRTPENGVMEYTSGILYFTTMGVRKRVGLQ